MYSSPSNNQGHDLAHALTTFLYDRLYGAIMADGERSLAAPTDPPSKAKLEPRSKLLAETQASPTLTMAQVTPEHLGKTHDKN